MSDQERTEFRDLIARVRDGSADAAWELVERYGPHIRAVVRRRLHGRLRKVFDSEDFVQSVWASMIRLEDQLWSIDDPDEFRGYLARMACNKVIDEGRRRTQTVARNMLKQVSIHQHGVVDQLTAHDPTASQYAMARERWRQLVQQQPPRTQQILQMRISGLTFREIAGRTRLHERTIRRIVDNFLRSYESNDSPHNGEENGLRGRAAP